MFGGGPVSSGVVLYPALDVAVHGDAQEIVDLLGLFHGVPGQVFVSHQHVLALEPWWPVETGGHRVPEVLAHGGELGDVQVVRLPASAIPDPPEPVGVPESLAPGRQDPPGVPH